MDTFELAAIPAKLEWLNPPQQPALVGKDELTITADAETDWFIDPAGLVDMRSAPVALFSPPDDHCLLSATVTVDFAAAFDAGVLFVHDRPDHWAKLCFEYSPQHKPGVVTVVTRGVSDDSNSVLLSDNTVQLRIYRQGDILAFHYRTDDTFWYLVRYFTLGQSSNLRIGFSAQSPTGQGCTARFSDIRYQARTLTNLRNGE